jgi:hypothetical protein
MRANSGKKKKGRFYPPLKLMVMTNQGEDSGDNK